jgi:flavin-dependent dehydrogenase
MEDFDVVVAGAGLAGLQCARQLARQNCKVLLVDSKPSPAAAVQTTGIFVRRTLEDFTFPDDCLGPPVRYVSLYSPSRRSLELESPHEEFRIGRMHRLYKHLLDDCQRAGVHWEPATRYLGSRLQGGSSKILLAGRKRRLAVTARYIVGADGACSKVARDLELGVNREWIAGLEDVYADRGLTGPPRFHCFLDAELSPGYLAWVVHDGEEVHVGVGGDPSRFNPGHALDAFSRSVGGIVDVRSSRRRERRGGLIPVGGVHRHLANARGLLVGDAAGAPSPLTAGGLDPCMRLSSFAAQVIASYLCMGNREALQAYSGQRFRSRFISRLWMRRLLSVLRSRHLLELTCWVLFLPLCRLLAGKVFFGRGSFPDPEPLLLNEIPA